MKHVVKKFLSKHKVGNDVVDVINSVPFNENAIAQLIQTKFENYYALLQTDDNELIQAFKYQVDDKSYFIPEPNPIVIYFEIGRHNSRQTAEWKSKVINELSQSKQNAYSIFNNFFTFYSISSISTIFLFNSIEAFINNAIPKDFKYSNQQKKSTEVYDKYQIQRYLTFEEKIKKVIPEIKQKMFHVEFSQKFESIIKLKNFRDEIMHTKAYDKSTPNIYQNLFTTSLDFNYEEVVKNVRDFINYYEPNLIEECECGKD
jgi:hypothetical protein